MRGGGVAGRARRARTGGGLLLDRCGPGAPRGRPPPPPPVSRWFRGRGAAVGPIPRHLIR